MWSEPDEYAEAVLDAVERIPPGRVLSYGDIAGLIGRGGPGRVGRVLSLWGGAVRWWGVTRADGHPPSGHEVEAHENYRAEGTPLRPGGRRVDITRARWT